MANSETITFNGIRFRRYPESPNWADRVYFVPGATHRQRGVGRLHQEIWKARNGPIPAGYHVHHADHDPLNNDPANLVLLDGDEHNAHHASQPDRIEISRRNIGPAQAAAAAWHGSPDGLAWHAEQGRRSWEGRESKTYKCEHCGEAYESLKPSRNRFCSNNCRAAARKASGVDDVKRACVICGESFTVNRYAKKATCSRSCGAKLSHLGKPRA
jgi:hypothetical protein